MTLRPTVKPQNQAAKFVEESELLTTLLVEDPRVFDLVAVLQSGRSRQGAQGAHLTPLGLFLNPLGLFLRTSVPFIWCILSAFLPARTPWLRGPVSPRRCWRTRPSYGRPRTTSRRASPGRVCH
jgi:hypothetical protein